VTSPRNRVSALERQLAELPAPQDDPNRDRWVRSFRACGAAAIASWALCDAPDRTATPRQQRRSEDIEPDVHWLLSLREPARPRRPDQSDDQWHRELEWAQDVLVRVLAGVHGAYPLPRKDQPCRLYPPSSPERRDQLCPEFGRSNERPPVGDQCVECFHRLSDGYERRFMSWLKEHAKSR
jgi:hypothetical protein